MEHILQLFNCVAPTSNVIHISARNRDDAVLFLTMIVSADMLFVEKEQGGRPKE